MKEREKESEREALDVSASIETFSTMQHYHSVVSPAIDMQHPLTLQEGPPSVPVLAIQPPSPPLPVPAPPGAPAPGVKVGAAAAFAYTPQQYSPIVAAAIQAAMKDNCACAKSTVPTQVCLSLSVTCLSHRLSLSRTLCLPERKRRRGRAHCLGLGASSADRPGFSASSGGPADPKIRVVSKTWGQTG